MTIDELIKVIVDNGISVIMCAAFLYYIFKQQAQNQEIVKAMNEMYKNLALINEKLGIKVTKKQTKEGE